MKLLYSDFQFVFDFKENTRNLLVVEHPGMFCQIVKELSVDDKGDGTGFVLSENEVPIRKKDHLLCIVNPLAVSLNERKLLGKLMDVLKRNIVSSELLLENNQILSELENYAMHIVQDVDWELTYADKIDVQGLLKFLGIQFFDGQESLLEKIVDYLKAVGELLEIKCFVFVHLLSYLTEYEVEKLYEYVQYHKIHILLLESRQPDIVKMFTKVIIIDKDACEIQLNM